MTYVDIFQKEKNLITKLGEEKAHTAWVMAKYLEEPDIEALAAIALTDGPDDKKIDFIYLDPDERRLVFTQGFYANKMRDSAPANKASDLNTAAAWLFSGDLNVVPETIRVVVDGCRQAIAADEIDTIELLYVHNLPESVNVARELQTAEDHVKKVIDSATITVRASELGAARIQYLHDSQESHIEVKDVLEFPNHFSFEETGPNWKAYVTSVPGEWLHNIYNKYGESLFSANYRGFLGGGRRRRVNSGIKESAEARGADFWAFNNGITMLTMNVVKAKSALPKLSGISIINGAQTTGSIGSVDISKKSLSDVRVLCRVIESSDQGAIADIVKFNNTQNAINAWDQYSNDPEQTRLAGEFKSIGITYNIKRGFLGSGNEISIDEVIQPLLAFHGRYQDANRGKNAIFSRKPLYQNAFEGKKARHALFIYSLSRAIDEKRLNLKEKSNTGSLIAVESDQLSLMRNLRFKYFFIGLAASTLETALGKPCDPFTVGFTSEASNHHSILELAARWSPVVETLLALMTGSTDAKEFSAKFLDDEFSPSLVKQMNALLHAMGSAEKHKSFSELVSGN